MAGNEVAGSVAAVFVILIGVDEVCELIYTVSYKVNCP
jgi:hypothetical protein